MEDDLDALGRALDEAGVADVAQADVDRGARRRIDLVEPAGRAARVVDTEGADAGALGDEPLDEMAADEPVGAGDEDRRVAKRGVSHRAPGPAARADRRRPSR